MYWTRLKFMKKTGMVDYFRDHTLRFGVHTETMCFLAYHWGVYNLGPRYGQKM